MFNLLQSKGRTIERIGKANLKVKFNWNNSFQVMTIFYFIVIAIVSSVFFGEQATNCQTKDDLHLMAM